MKHFAFLTLGLHVLAGARVVVATDDIESPIPGYDIFIPSWEVSATPDGPSIVLNGTVEQVHEQLIELNPNYDADFAITVSGEDDTITTANYLDRFPSNSGHNCFGRWHFVFTDTLWDGINYLRRIGGQPSMSAGPGTCGRVSCSYRTAIYWCNDVRNHISNDALMRVVPRLTF
jgi:hypothetical protein